MEASNNGFNGFPTDGSYGSQIQYGLFVKYMGNALNFASSVGNYTETFSIIGVLLQLILTALILSAGIIIGLILIFFLIIKKVYRIFF